jgi:hypothetical protein
MAGLTVPRTLDRFVDYVRGLPREKTAGEKIVAPIHPLRPRQGII